MARRSENDDSGIGHDSKHAKLRIKDRRRTGSQSKSGARTKDRPDYSKAQTGFVTTVDRGRITCRLNNGEQILAMKARELGKKSIVVGDQVGLVGNLSGTDGTLARAVSVGVRRNTLTRTIDDEANFERQIVANVDQMAIMIAATNPEPRHGFVDRALVVAFDQGIKPLIIMTKIDLIANPNSEFLEPYLDLGLKINEQIFIFDKGSDLSKLHKTLLNQTTVFIGHSGVGKSSLVNRLIGSDQRAVGSVNENTGRGRHTSSSAFAIPLGQTGWIIDTPGVRSFGISHIKINRIFHAFPELEATLNRCPKNCSHDEAACELNQISAANLLTRVQSLRRLLASI